MYNIAHDISLTRDLSYTFFCKYTIGLDEL